MNRGGHASIPEPSPGRKSSGRATGKDSTRRRRRRRRDEPVGENCYFKGTACPSARLSVVPATTRCVNRESWTRWGYNWCVLADSGGKKFEANADFTTTRVYVCMYIRVETDSPHNWSARKLIYPSTFDQTEEKFKSSQ